jgi:hypothetical protein
MASLRDEAFRRLMNPAAGVRRVEGGRRFIYGSGLLAESSW